MITNLSDSEFWNFSFHEMGIHDIPAILSYITNVTKAEKQIIYIGHSMGSTMFFVYASSVPNATNYVKAMVALAPVAYLTNVHTPVRHISKWSKQLQYLSRVMGVYEMFPKSQFYKTLCCDYHVFMNVSRKVCESVLHNLSGVQLNKIDDNFMRTILKSKPAGTSVKTFVHYGQIIENRGEFRQFDYGIEQNLKLYGEPRPPAYDLSKISVPTYFIYALNDVFSTPSDVTKLARNVRPSPDLYEIPLRTFTHVDFLWAREAVDNVYKPLIKFISKFRWR